MGFKDLFTVLVSLICFALMCCAAPTKQTQDLKVHSWLEDWTEKLVESGSDTFWKYESIRFSGRRNMPFLDFRIMRYSFTRIGRQTSENILKALCRQLTEFTSPVYLAFYDESQRLDSNADLTRSLLNVSITLNSTLEMARNLLVRKFPNAQQNLVAKPWSRSDMYSIAQNYKNKTRDTASINELRTWATLSDVIALLKTFIQLDLIDKI